MSYCGPQFFSDPLFLLTQVGSSSSAPPPPPSLLFLTPSSPFPLSHSRLLWLPHPSRPCPFPLFLFSFRQQPQVSWSGLTGACPTPPWPVSQWPQWASEGIMHVSPVSLLVPSTLSSLFLFWPVPAPPCPPPLSAVEALLEYQGRARGPSGPRPGTKGKTPAAHPGRGFSARKATPHSSLSCELGDAMRCHGRHKERATCHCTKVICTTVTIHLSLCILSICICHYVRLSLCNCHSATVTLQLSLYRRCNALSRRH